MKELVFNTERDFLDELDGKVYAVSNSTGWYICDILEEDYIRLTDRKIIIDMDSKTYHNLVSNADSDCILVNTFDSNTEKQFIEKYGVKITINKYKQYE